MRPSAGQIGKRHIYVGIFFICAAAALLVFFQNDLNYDGRGIMRPWLLAVIIVGAGIAEIVNGIRWRRK